MLIIVDKRMPPLALETLSQFGEVVEFSTNDICYEAISCHPDIFIFQSPGGLIISPNLPGDHKKTLKKFNITFMEGEIPVGGKYPCTAHYNALFSRYGIIHNIQVTDPAILSLNQKMIHCNQAYVRCNAIEAGKYIITSDRGIEKALLKFSLNVFYVDPAAIILPGYRNGFFGGCCGIWKNKFFVCGSLKYISEGKKLLNLLIDEGFEVVELYDGKLFDAGGLFFI